LNKILKALKECEEIAIAWIKEKKSGRVSLHLNFGQGSLVNWQIETSETRKV